MDLRGSGKNIDLIQAVIINLGDPHSTENPILRLMGVLLSDTIKVHEKKKIMEEEFHIAMTMELESEVSELCNLSQGIYNEGVTEGINQGLDKGIIGAVELLREDGHDDQTIIKRIMSKYHLTLEAAKKYVLLPAASKS